MRERTTYMCLCSLKDEGRELCGKFGLAGLGRVGHLSASASATMLGDYLQTRRKRVDSYVSIFRPEYLPCLPTPYMPHTWYGCSVWYGYS